MTSWSEQSTSIRVINEVGAAGAPCQAKLDPPQLGHQIAAFTNTWCAWQPLTRSASFGLIADIGMTSLLDLT